MRRVYASTKPNEDLETGVIAEKKTELREPAMFRVLLLNDDFTPMDFVVGILERFFHKNNTEATEIMLRVHNDGRGECGVFPFEIAETKVALVNEHAREHEFPLQCNMERI